MNNSQETANLIKSLANLKGVSISKLLLDCELNKNALYTMQSSGYFPRVEALAKIADYLDVSIDYLLGRTNRPQVINFSDGGDAFLYISSNIAEKIKTMAKIKKIQIKDMLKDCELGKNSLSSMQSGGSIPKSDTLAKIADYLGVSVDYLLGRTNNPDIIVYDLDIIEQRIILVATKMKLSKNKLLMNANMGKNLFDNMKRGSIPSVEKIHIIADYLNVSVDYLLGRTDNPTVNE